MDFALGGEHLWGAIGMDWNASYAKATEERPNERYLDFQLKKQEFDMDLSDERQPLATPGTGATLTLSDKFSLKELTEQQEDIKEEDMKFSANFKASLNNGAKLKFGAKVVRKTKEKEIDFYEYTPKDEDAFMTNSLKNTVDQSTDKFMPSDKYQVGTFASKEYVGGLNLNDASQFDKEQVQAELAENFEARETVSSGYVRFDHKFASDINLMAGLRMEHTSLRYTGRNYDDETDKTTKTGRSRLVFTEIPYQVNKGALQEKIAQLVNDKRIEGISDMRDESNQKGIRLVIELKKGVIPQVVLNNLYKYTSLQTTFGANNLALVNGVPKCLSLREMLQHYIDHQVDVVTRRTRFDLKKAQARAHILEGYLMALDHIDEVISIIRSSQTDSEASGRLIERFGFTPEQTTAILEMKLRRLTGLERDKIQEELDGLRRAIAYYEDLLAHEEKILGVIKEEMREISKKFGDKRRTEISQVEKDLDVEDLIADEDMVVTITHTGYVKRIPVAAYRAQKRGGKGVSGVNLKEDDVIDEMFIASTHEYVLFFSSKGKVYRLKVHELPVGTRQARGTAIVNLLPFEEGEKIASVISCREFPADEYLMFATKSGMVKKTVMSAYDRSRRDGLIAINLRDDDALLAVRRVREGDKIILATTAGKAIMFPEDQVRATGRDTSGVRGISMKDGVSVLGMEVTNGNGDLFVITERGYGKRTPVADYPEQNRGGQGVYTIQMTERKGNLAAMKTVGPQHELFIVTEGATVIRVKTDEISQTGRATQGVKMMTVDDNDRVCAVARMTAAKEKPEGEGAEAAVDTEEAPVDLGDGNDMPEDLLDE